MTEAETDPNSLIGPSFLNRPSRVNVGGKFELLTQALLYHRAGPRPPQELVDASVKTGDFSEIRANYPGVTIVPPGLTTDGPSVPGYPLFVVLGAVLALVTYWFMAAYCMFWVFLATGLRAAVDPYKFLFAGYLHDYLCTWLLQGRAAADGELRVACAALGMGWWPCFFVFLGVRLGTIFRYKTTVPKVVQQQAVNAFAKSRGLLSSNFTFDEAHSRVVRV